MTSGTAEPRRRLPAAERKAVKYVQLNPDYTFVPGAIETLGPINNVGPQFLSDPGFNLIEGAFLVCLLTNATLPSCSSVCRYTRYYWVTQLFNVVATRYIQGGPKKWTIFKNA